MLIRYPRFLHAVCKNFQDFAVPLRGTVGNEMRRRFCRNLIVIACVRPVLGGVARILLLSWALPAWLYSQSPVWALQPPKQHRLQAEGSSKKRKPASPPHRRDSSPKAQQRRVSYSRNFAALLLISRYKPQSLTGANCALPAMPRPSMMRNPSCRLAIRGRHPSRARSGANRPAAIS